VERTLNLAAVRDEYMLNCQIDGKARGTLRIYENVTGLFLSYLGEDTEITPTRIRGFLLWLSEVRGQNPTTVNINCRALRTFLRWMAREGYVSVDPMREIKTPKVPSKFPNVLSDDELRQMLAVAKRDPRDRAILLVLLDTGVRASELCGLSIEDVCLATRTAKVLGKGGRERTIFFSVVTARALAKWLTVRPDVAFDDPLFTSAKRKERLTPHGLLEVVQRLAKDAGVNKRVGCHTVRHSFATAYVRAGGDAHTLQHLLGHSTLFMAMRYVDLVGRDLAEAHGRYSPVMRLQRGR
jgi:site-specific recombinase XerD